jgi:hypothetical protein
MRRRRGLISAIGKLLSEGLGFENPRSSQTGGSYCDPSLIAAPAASFNPESQQALALQLQLIEGSESMGDHDSGSDDWWCVG